MERLPINPTSDLSINISISIYINTKVRLVEAQYLCTAGLCISLLPHSLTFPSLHVPSSFSSTSSIKAETTHRVPDPPTLTLHIVLMKTHPIRSYLKSSKARECRDIDFRRPIEPALPPPLTKIKSHKQPSAISWLFPETC